MAAPHVAGVAGLIISDMFEDYDKTRDWEKVKARLLGSAAVADESNPLSTLVLTGGRLDAYASLDDEQLPPGKVSDVVVVSTTFNSATITWTASGDDGAEGRAALYDIRYSTNPLTEENWDEASRVLHELFPKPFGNLETVTIEELHQNTPYYFGVRVMDNAANLSELSNQAAGTTMATGAPSQLKILSGDGQVGAAGTALGNPLVVQVTDDMDNPVSDVLVTFALETDTTAQLSAAVVLTNARGEASTIFTLGPELDADNIREYAVSANVLGLAPVQFVAFGHLKLNLLAEVWKSPSFEVDPPTSTSSVNVARFDDLDGDGFQEIVTQSFGSPSGQTLQAKLHVLDNMGTNTYEETWSSEGLSPGGTIVNLTVTDMDRDGNRELVAVQLNGKIWIFESNADNGFDSGQVIADLYRPANLAFPRVKDMKIADTDGDGKMEIVVLMSGTNFSSVTIVEHRGTEGLLDFDDPIEIYDTVTRLVSFGVGDGDSDDNQEIYLATTGNLFSIETTSFRRLEYSPSSNTYMHKITKFPVGRGATKYLVADLDGDDVSEVVARTDSGKFLVFSATGDDEYQIKYESPAIGKSNIIDAKVVSISGVQRPVIVALEFSGKLHFLSLLRDQLAHIWESETVGGGNAMRSLDIADADQDGKNEFLITSSSEHVYLYEELDIPELVVEITNPKQGDIMTGGFRIDVSTNLQPSQVVLSVDGEELESFSEPPYEFNVQAGALGDGPHTIEAEAYFSEFSQWIVSEPVSINVSLLVLDVDGNGQVNNADITLLHLYINHHILPTEVAARIEAGLAMESSLFDVDRNGTVEFRDVVFIFRRANGHPTVADGVVLHGGLTRAELDANIDALLSN